jgi:hypothetical protein
VRPLATGPGSISDEAIVGLDPDEHRIALEDDAIAAVEAPGNRFLEGIRQKIGADVGDSHQDAESGYHAEVRG